MSSLLENQSTEVLAIFASFHCIPVSHQYSHLAEQLNRKRVISDSFGVNFDWMPPASNLFLAKDEVLSMKTLPQKPV